MNDDFKDAAELQMSDKFQGREHVRTIEDAIRAVCREIETMLLEKNAAYGNSAADPVRVFARGVTARQQIHVRMDDKLSRIARGHEYGNDDTKLDLAGYLILEMAIDRIGGFDD